MHCLINGDLPMATLHPNTTWPEPPASLSSTNMELGVDKENLLRTLRSDLTGLELRTGHGTMSVFDKSDDGSDGSGSLLSSPDLKDDIVVYTHDDMLSSLTKQLEIQREVTNICERDLQYRTEIIELLSSRIVELEAEAHSWKEQKKSFSALKEKMMYLEQLYGGDGARELELSTFTSEDAAPVIPEGQTLVGIETLDLLKSRLDSTNAEMENWRNRIAALEGSLAEETEKHVASRHRYDALEGTYRKYQTSSTDEITALQVKIDELLSIKTQTENRNTELMASLDSASEQIKQLTLDIGVAEEMRNASLASASAESQEYARLRGRLTELEGQLAMSREETDDLAVKLESMTNSLSEANEKLNLSESKLEDLDRALASARSELAALEAAMATASATSSKTIAELEVKLETVTREGDERANLLRAEIDTLAGERDHARSNVSALESRITEHEAEKEERERKVSELEATSSTLSQRVSDLEAELSSSKTRYDELLSTSTSNETAANAKMAALQDQAAAAAHAAETRITELDAEIIVIRERCTHHIAELTEAKASAKDLETTKATLSETNERVTELEDQLLEAEGRAGGFDAQLSEAEEKIQEYEKLQLGHSEAMELLKKEHASALAEYEGRLSEMTSGATTNASRHASLENEVAALTAKLSSLDSDLTAVKTEKDTIRINFERQSKSAEDSHNSALAVAASRSKALEEQLNAAEESRKLLEKQLADPERSTSTTQSQSTEAQARLETSLQETEVKLSLLQSDLEEKNALLEQLELRVVAVTDLETQLEELKREHKTSTAKSCAERDELKSQVASFSVQVSDTQQRETELKTKLDKALADVSQRQARIEFLEKESKEQGGRSSVDESQLQDLYAEHERQITQMEQDYDELRIERDGIIAERDDIIEERDSHHSRIEELEKRIKDLEASQKSDAISSFVSSPTDINSPGGGQSIAELRARLQELEQKRVAAEKALLVRSYSNDSEVSERSRDSMIIVESVDEHGNSEIHEVQKIGSDADSDGGSDHTADHSTMAASISMASTTSSVAEQEAAAARAEQAAMERSRRQSLAGKDGDEKGKHRLSLFRHDSTKSTHSGHSGHSHSGMSIASALSGASRMVGSIGHGEGHHLFPERTRKSSEHSHHEGNDEHHHDMSNPFLLFAGRSRTDSHHSHHSGSTKSGSTSTSAVPASPSVEPPSPAKSSAMAERERKAKEKLEKAERERAEKAAKVEKERAHKAEKAAKREQERLEREQKEKDRKARLKADPNGVERLTALRQGAGNYYETN